MHTAMEYAAFAAAALVGAILQGVTGFGCGIIMMLVLPFIYDIPQAAAVSSVAGLVLAASMAWRYRAHADLKTTLPFCVPYLICSGVAIMFSTQVDQELLKRVFGVFLLALAAYNFATMGKASSKKLPAIAQLGCIVFSGICDGLFGIGGPLMVLFFLSRTDTQEDYLANIQLFFTVNMFVNLILRAVNGVLTVDLAPMCVLGAVFLIIGLQIANRLLDRLNRDVVLKLTYAAIALCGITNVL